MTSTCEVYRLIDPRNGVARYIGYSKDAFQRFEGHLRDALAGRSHKARWIRSLLNIGLSPVLQVLCVVENKAEAQRIEIALISKSVNLTNATSGGDGGDTFTCNPNREELRAKFSARNKLRYQDPSERIKVGRPGRLVSTETRAKLGAVRRGKSGSLKGRQHPPDCPHCIAIRNRKHPPDCLHCLAILGNKFAIGQKASGL